MTTSDPTDAAPSTTTPSAKRFRIISLREEGVERKLALAFGFMSVIPIMIVWAWGKVNGVDVGTVIYCMAASVLIGYFMVARRMIRSVLRITRKARELSSGRLGATIDVEEDNEIGELARSFNRITQELERKIDDLESSRQQVKRLLARIGTAIVSYEGIDTLLNLIIENTSGALEAQMGSLMLVDGENQDLYVKTAWSSDGQTADPSLRIKLGESVAGWVAKEGRPMRSQIPAGAMGFRSAPGADAAALSVPLKLRDRPIGVVTVLRENPQRTFSEDDESLLTSIGSQMAVAIENYRLNLDVERTYLETIMALALAVEAKDPYSAGHSKRVGYYASLIAQEMGLDEDTQRALNDAGTLHDIGKIGIKDEILLKPVALTPEEQKVMQQHSVIGEAIVKPVRSLSRVSPLVRHHHERYDGGGYPSGLKGEQIPLGARILSVADTYDAMVTDRPYRKRLSLDDTKAELKRLAGVQHDPAVVDAFLRVLAKKEERLAGAPRDPV